MTNPPLIPPVDDQTPPPDLTPDTSLNVDTTTPQSDGNRALFLLTLGEKDREIARLQALANQNNTPQVRQTPEEQWQQFTSAPKDMIREEVASQFTNVNSFIAEVAKEREITKLKNAFRSDPRYAPIFQFAEAHLDQFLASSNTINTQTMQLALLTVSGAIATGQIQVPGLNLNLNSSTPNNPAPNNNDRRSNITPPNTPRTTTPLPQNTEPTGEDTTPLTENERRLMRSFNMSEEDYRAGKKEAPLTVPNKKVS